MIARARPRRDGALLVPALWLACAALLHAGALPLSAQEPSRPRADPRARVLERLRALDQPERRDTVPADTASPGQPGQPSPGRRLAAGQRAPASPAGQEDAVERVLRALEGYMATEYQAAGVRYLADSGTVALKGKAELTRTGQGMTADSLLLYNLRSEVVCGYGKPVLSGQQTSAPVQSEQVCYNVGTQTGVALGARTKFTQGANWLVHGEKVYTAGTERLYGHHAEFTDCDLETPHYHFAADRVKIINDEVMVARDVTLNFADVPVFWLPFMVQNLKQGRRSGILTPRFGMNDIARQSSRYDRHISDVGFYWAISDYLGFETKLDWFSDHWTSLEGTFDYRWNERFLSGAGSFRRFWNEDGGKDFMIRGNHSWQLAERTSMRADANYSSSTSFIRQNAFDPRELNRSIDSNAGFQHSFTWGGSIGVGASRRQYLSDDKVETRLSLNPTWPSLTLFRAPEGQARWFNNLTWTGNASLSGSGTNVQDTLPGVQVRDRRSIDGLVSSGFSVGNFSLSQTLNVSDRVDLPKGPVGPDLELPRFGIRQLGWSTSLSYRQRLFGTTNLTPGLTLTGGSLSNDTLGRAVRAPSRLNFNASLQTDVYGFWPGVGPFSRIRHKVSPSLSYQYAPAVTPDAIQRQVFGAAELLKQNQLTIGFNQTIEAKREVADTAGVEGGEPADTAEVAEPEPEQEGPRRRQQVPVTTLLSISTNAIAYDFVRAEEDTTGSQWPGLVTGQISNSVTSDLLRGLSLTFTHDLFETPVVGGVQGPRRFDPHLSDVTASFSLTSDSWIFRVLGLGRAGEAEPPGAQPRDTVAPGTSIEGPAPRTNESGLGLMPGQRRARPEASQGGRAGSWNASINYNLVRPRAVSGLSGENQMLRGSVSFHPTPQWRVHWNTSYSFTEGAFSDHILTLSRDLHDWEANFDFYKAQNGNFSFQFRASLRANPDIKVDYEQRGEAARTRRPGTR